MRLSLQLVLVLLSAAILPLCFPPFGWWPLVLLTFPPLLLATTHTTVRRAFYLGLLQGTIGYGATLYWLFRIFGTAAIPLFAILALFTAAFCVLDNFITKRIQFPVLSALLAATIWTAIEFYRSELFILCFPWITPGSALGPTFLSPIVGVYGTSFVVIAASAWFMHRRTIPLAVLLSLCVLCLGLFRPGLVLPDKKGGITVTVVQSEDCLLQSYIALTRTAYKDSPALIVWPENSLPYDIRKDIRDFSKLTNLCTKMNAVLVFGTKTIIGSGARDWHNTALILDKHGVIGEYHKARPVHLFNDGIAGHQFTPIQTELGAFATPICFDCDYSEVARKMATLGAEFFIVPSFDAEGWSVDQHLQHALLFRLRAAENARWLACAASSGVSQIIDPHGNVHKSLPPMKTGVVTDLIGRSSRKTVFTCVGWIFPWLTLGCLALLLGYAALTCITQRQRNA